jgi:hypothetical protein
MRKIVLSLALIFSAHAFANADPSNTEQTSAHEEYNTATFTDKNAIQNELNVKWAVPLQRAYTAYRCGYESDSDSIIRQMTQDTTEASKGSVVAYGFLLGYSEHLDALNYETADRSSICAEFDKAKGSDFSKNSFDENSSVDAINHIIETTGIVSRIGKDKINDLLVTTTSLQRTLGVDLNTSLLMSACDLPDANRSMPNAVRIINSAGLMGEPNKEKIKNALDVWFGFSQGSYWHALYLLNSTDKKEKVCSNLSAIKANTKND